MVIETYQNKNFLYYLKVVIGFVEFATLRGFSWTDKELLVLNLHSTPKKLTTNFENHIKFLRKNFNIIKPSDLRNSQLHSAGGKPKLLLTFDDGLKNNLYAAEILEKYDLQALFFIVPEFVESSLKKEGKKYYLTNIRPVVNPKFDKEPEDFESLSWLEIKRLVNAGHSIGSHTMSHLLNSDMEDYELNSEITESKKFIEEKVDVTIMDFCSPNNTALSVSRRALQFIELNYKFHFTTYHGANDAKNIPHQIKRINIESYWDLGVVKFALGRFQNNRMQS